MELDLLVVGLIGSSTLLAGILFWALVSRASYREIARRVPELERRLSEESEVAADLATRNAALETELTLLDDGMSDRFAALSRATLDQNKLALTDLLKPVSEKLAAFDRKVGDVEASRKEAYGALTSQLRGLADAQGTLFRQTHELSTALKRSGSDAGRWGEMQLLRVVELAGMRAHCDYDEQVTLALDDQILRPDMVIHLPGGQHIVIDAKAPTSAYLAAQSEEDETKRQQLLDNYIRNLRDIMGRLAKKSYWKAVEGPEFVLLFLPAESFYAHALERDPKLIEDGFKDGVVLATPTTLLTLLKAAAYGWRQDALADNAKEVGRLGAEVYDRLAVLNGHVSRLGRALNSSVAAFNKTVGSLEGPVAHSVEKLKAASIETDGRKIEQPELLDTAVRMPLAPSNDTRLSG